MNHKYFITAAVLSGLFAMPAAAKAADIRAYTNTSAALLAGPDTFYPPVAQVASGADVQIMGCTDGFKWCDVEWNGNRGWINANNLNSNYNNRRVSIIEYGPRANLPVVVFEQKPYWDSYYHDRPFYTERRYWRTEIVR
jgi:uncharacterized protein YraI